MQSNTCGFIPVVCLTMSDFYVGHYLLWSRWRTFLRASPLATNYFDLFFSWGGTLKLCWKKLFKWQFYLCHLQSLSCSHPCLTCFCLTLEIGMFLITRPENPTLNDGLEFLSFLCILTNYIWARLNYSIRFMSFSYSLRNLQLCKGFLTVLLFFFSEGVGFASLLNPRYRDWDGRSFTEIFLEFSSEFHLTGTSFQRVWIFIREPQWHLSPV